MTVQFPDSTPQQIDYTSRDYDSIREDLIVRVKEKVPDWDSTDPADFGMVLLEAFAYLGDIMSYYIDRAANESSLTTATRRDSVIALARDLGYTPSGYSSSVVDLEFTNTSEESITLPARTVVSGTVTDGDIVYTISFETDTEVTIASNDVSTVSATQGQIVDGDFGFGEFLGTSDGTASQTFTMSTDLVVMDSIQVYVYDLVNYLPWTRIENFADYGPLARVFEPVITGADTIEIRFGDGVSGLVPTFGNTIFVRYRRTDGARGNVVAGSINEIDAIPGLASVQVSALVGSLSVTNNSSAYGGTDQESTESIRALAPVAYRTANRAVTLEDYQNIALGVLNCGKASAQSSSPAAVVVAVAPYRSPGTAEVRPGYFLDQTSWTESDELIALKSRVASRLAEVSLVSVQTSVISPVYVDVYIGIDITLEDSVRQSDASVLITQAILAALSYNNTPFGASIYPADLIALVSSLGGITLDIAVTRLNVVGSGSNEVGVVTAEEDEILQVLESNIELNITGGTA